LCVILKEKLQSLKQCDTKIEKIELNMVSSFVQGLAKQLYIYLPVCHYAALCVA